MADERPPADERRPIRIRGAKPGLDGHDRGAKVLTRAFSGRPARGLPNRFITDFGPLAPLGYPAVHHLTSERN